MRKPIAIAFKPANKTHKHKKPTFNVIHPPCHVTMLYAVKTHVVMPKPQSIVAKSLRLFNSNAKPSSFSKPTPKTV